MCNSEIKICLARNFNVWFTFELYKQIYSRQKLNALNYLIFKWRDYDTLLIASYVLILRVSVPPADDVVVESQREELHYVTDTEIVCPLSHPTVSEASID